MSDRENVQCSCQSAANEDDHFLIGPGAVVPHTGIARFGTISASTTS